MSTPDTQHKDLFEFCLSFAMNCKTMPADVIYKSYNGKYRIEYLSKNIVEYEIIKDGEVIEEEITVSIRISKDNGLVQVSQYDIKDKSESFILFALLSVFSMYYVSKNVDMNDHIEADINAFLIMKANGYKIKSLKEFNKDFTDSLSDNLNSENVDRCKTVAEFVADYDSKQIEPFKISDEWKQEVTPVMERVFEKSGIGYTDESMLGDVNPKD